MRNFKFLLIILSLSHSFTKETKLKTQLLEIFRIDITTLIKNQAIAFQNNKHATYFQLNN
jgi:hypothetical protein